MAEGTFVSQLIQLLPAEALPDLALFYHLLLSALPILAPAAGSRADKEEPRFVNALVCIAAFLCMQVMLTASLQAAHPLSSSACMCSSGQPHRGMDCANQALGSDLLPRLWAWAAPALRLPKEAPMEATRGWDIAALQHGAPGLLPAHAAVLGFFCRRGFCNDSLCAYSTDCVPP